MNKNLTEIAIVMDRSGSMANCAEAAIDGFNTFVREQRETPGDARLTLVLFDTIYEIPYQSIPLAEVTDLDSSTFVPRGGTALLDAIGRTIDELGVRLSERSEETRPGQVIVPILTDGLENASVHFTWQAISEKIGHQQDHYGWQFLFLGANQDAIATAARMSIAARDSSNFLADGIGLRSQYRAVSRKTSAWRTLSSRGWLDAEQDTDFQSSLSNLVEEEDRKRRRKDSQQESGGEQQTRPTDES